MHFRNLGRAVASLALILAVGCGDSQGPDGSTQFSVLLKDAPGDVTTAMVTIEEVQLVGEGGITVLRDDPLTVDLLTLANTTASLVTDVVVPSGTYSQLRFVISGAYIETENADGSTSIYASSPAYEGLPAGAAVAGSLQMPSLAQSGLKVTLPANALTLTGDEKILLVDFDVSQSFGHAAGQSGGWVMHPVITGAEIETTAGAQIAVSLGDGVVLPNAAALGQFEAKLTNTATAAVTTVPLTDPDADGTFGANFAFLTPGDYELTLVLPAGVTSVTTNPVTPLSVTIVSGQPAAASLTVTGAL